MGKKKKVLDKLVFPQEVTNKFMQKLAMKENVEFKTLTSNEINVDGVIHCSDCLIGHLVVIESSNIASHVVNDHYLPTTKNINFYECDCCGKIYIDNFSINNVEVVLNDFGLPDDEKSESSK